MIPAIVGAVIVGLTLGLLGSGGSILTVPLLELVLGHTEKSAIVESYAIVGVISAFGGIRRAQVKQVDWRAVLTFGPFSMIGAAFGVWISSSLTGSQQFALLGLLMLAAAGSMLRPGKRKIDGQDVERAPTNGVLLAIIGVCVGVLTGLVGIGGGFLFVPALVALGGVEMRLAIGTSLVLIALNCAASFAKFLSAGDGLRVEIDGVVVVLFGVVGIAGSVLGQAIADRINRAMLKKIFGVFVLVLGLYMLVSRLDAIV